MQALGKLLIFAGLFLTLVGVVVYFGGRLSFLGLGRLPGDIRVDREHFKFYFPITTCILISIILSLALYLISRFR